MFSEWIDADGWISPHHPNCFGCGPENRAGLGLRMRREGEGVRADLVLGDRHEGAPGLAHGGAVAAALDDLFGGLLVVLEEPAVTANLSVDFRHPVRLGKPLLLRAAPVGVDGRKLTFRGTVEAQGTLVAEATALFVRVELSHFESTEKPIPEAWLEWGAAPSDPTSDPDPECRG